MPIPFILIIAALLAHRVDAFPKWVDLKALDIPAPRCEGMANFDVASDYFVEIANPLPGKEEYNELVRFFEAKSWAQFDEKFEVFRKAFETSPLREAATFLEAQSLLSQADISDESHVKNAERKIREVLLLYPKSKLVPVLLMNAANFALTQKNYSKALGLFESGRQDYPFHELHCRFLLGVAESNYLLRDEKTAKQGFQFVSQKCNDPLTRLVAATRIADIELPTNKKQSLATYEALASKFPVRMAKYTSWALFNTGELKYNKGEYASSKYYFTEFARFSSKSDCFPWAMKRVADIALRSRQPKEEVIGSQMAVYDKAPTSDVGKFSRLHGFLIDLENSPAAEQERRFKILDVEIEKIGDESLRSLLFLEKGLAQLSLGEKAAIAYLVRFSERKEEYFKDINIINYVRGQILSILEKEVKEVAKRQAQRSDNIDNKIFDPLEQAYSVWFKGSPYEARAKGIYQRLILSRMKDLFENDNPAEAVARLERWEKSGIWAKSGPPKESHTLVASAFLRLFYLADDEARKGFAQAMDEKAEVLKPFLTGELESVWLAAWLAKGEKGRVKAYFSSRALASETMVSFSPELRSQLMLLKGKSARYIGKFELAERFFSKVSYPSLIPEAARERFQVARELEQPGKMLELVSLLENHSTNEELISLLDQIAETIAETKRWSLAEPLFKKIEQTRTQKSQLVPFYALRGRANFESGNYLKAIEYFETALTIAPELEKKADIKFRLGKSYLKTKQKERAIKQWEELAQMKDASWSPLAENELRLIQGK